MQNPWFRDGNDPSLAGWIDAAASSPIWSLSQKQSNPTPDQVMGTSARLAFGSGQGGGIGQAGVDAYLYQVVSADPSQTHLKFKLYWVTQWIDGAAVTIYGGNSADGPWTAVWVPFEVDQNSSSGGAWRQTDFLDTTIAEGFPFYKIELFGRYSEGRQQGVKYTGVYFATDGEAGELSAAPVIEPTNEIENTPEPTAVPPTNTPIPVVEENPEQETAVAAAITAEPEPTERPARPTQAPPQTADEPVTSSQIGDRSLNVVYIIIIGVLLLLVAVLGIGWARTARRGN